MFKKLFGESKIDKLEAKFEAKFATMEAERVETAEENERLAAELKAIQDAKSPKELATEAGEPWIDVIEFGFDDPANPATGHLELDWNQQFVDLLVEKGYSGREPSDVIDQYVNDLCRGIIGDNI